MTEYKCLKCEFKSLKLYNTRRHFLRFHEHEENKCAGKGVDATGKGVDATGKGVDAAGKGVDATGKGVDEIQDILLSNQCNKCRKIFTRMYGLKVHIETCEGLKDVLQCMYCNTVFTHKSNKYHHLKICKEKLINEQKQLIINNNNTTNNNTINNITNNINSNNITNNNTINIQLNNFGQENVSYLSPEFLNNCYDLGPKSIKNIILGIYFDENHPENHTVKLISLKNEYVNVHKDGDWHPKTINDAMDIMKQLSSDTLIKSKIDEINEILNKKKLNENDNINIDKMQLIQNIPQKIEKEINKSAIINLIAVKNKEEI